MNIQEGNLNNFFCFGARRCSRKITNFFDNYLKKLGVKSTQIHLLLAISLGGKSLTKISENLGMDRTTLTRGVVPLERDRLIRKVYSSNRRDRVYALTDHGEDIKNRGLILLQEAERIIASKLGSERYERISGDLLGFEI